MCNLLCVGHAELCVAFRFLAVINDVFYLEVNRNCMLKLSVKYFLVLIIANMATVRNVLLVLVKCNFVRVVRNVDRIIEE